MTSRNYSANAVAASLTAGVNDSTTTIPVSLTTGWPAVPFIVAVGYGAADQEVALVTAVAGLNLTVTRGYDNTTAQAHLLGAVIRPVHSAVDFRDSRTHEAATDGVHGITGDVVGTTGTQALTNKDLSSGTNTFPASLITASGAATVTNKDLSSGTNTFPASLATDAEVTSAVSTHAALTATHGVSGAVVGTTDTQTLTNKTFADPVVTGVGEVRYVKKSVDTPRSSTTTLADDPHLTFSVVANAEYVVDGIINAFDTGSVASGGGKFTWSLPAGATFDYARFAYPNGFVDWSNYSDYWATEAGMASGSLFMNAPASRTRLMKVSFRIATSGTAGTAALQWAQNTSDATPTTVYADSYLTVRRVA